MTTLQQRLRHPVGCTLEDRIAAADAIECDRSILAARTNIMNQQCAAMKAALEALQAFVEYDRGDHEDSVGMMISYAVALSMAKDAIAALKKETTHENYPQ